MGVGTTRIDRGHVQPTTDPGWKDMPFQEKMKAIEEVLDVAFKDIEPSENYKKRIEAVVERIQSRGIDITALGPIHEASFLISGMALAAVVNINNDFHI